MVPGYPGEDNNDGEENGGKIGSEDERKLFAHLLWSAALIVAEGVERAAVMEVGGLDEEMRWSVKGENVLELGAG